jgi:2'-5' RNA ligase
MSVYTRPKHGLFFAAMVPAPQAEKISILFNCLQTRYPIQKPRIPDERLHISLLPMLTADSLPEKIIHFSQQAGDAIRFVEFDVTLDRILTYRNKQAEKPLVLAADADSTSKANGLVDRLRQTISTLSGASPYHTGSINPHVTLVWDRLSIPEQSVPPITMPIREVALVHSHIGKSKYDILGRWQLVPRA